MATLRLMDFKPRNITKDRGTFHNDESIYHENKSVLIYTYWTKDRQLNNYNAPLSISNRECTGLAKKFIWVSPHNKPSQN